MLENNGIGFIKSNYLVIQSNHSFGQQPKFSQKSSFGAITIKEICQKISQYNIYSETLSVEPINVALRWGEHDEVRDKGFGLVHIKYRHPDLINLYHEHFLNSAEKIYQDPEIIGLIRNLIDSLNSNDHSGRIKLLWAPESKRFIFAVEFKDVEKPIFIRCVLYPTAANLLEIVTLYSIDEADFDQMKTNKDNVMIYSRKKQKADKAEPKKGNNQDEKKEDNNTDSHLVTKKKKKRKAKKQTYSELDQLLKNNAKNKELVEAKDASICTFNELALDGIIEPPILSRSDLNAAYIQVWRNNKTIYASLKRLEKTLVEFKLDVENINRNYEFAFKLLCFSESNQDKVNDRDHYELFKRIDYLKGKDLHALMSQYNEEREKIKFLTDLNETKYEEFYNKNGYEKYVKSNPDGSEQVYYGQVKDLGPQQERADKQIKHAETCAAVNIKLIDKLFRQDLDEVSKLQQEQVKKIDLIFKFFIKILAGMTSENLSEYVSCARIVNLAYKKLCTMSKIVQKEPEFGMRNFTTEELGVLTKIEAYQPLVDQLKDLAYEPSRSLAPAQ